MWAVLQEEPDSPDVARPYLARTQSPAATQLIGALVHGGAQLLFGYIFGIR